MILRRGWHPAAGMMLLAAGLGACSRVSDAAASALPATPVEDSFGPGFGTAFRADPNSAPINPNARDVVPVNPTAEPINVP